ncbi:hypothetical protein NIES4071_106410 (plasmid) [Calothrix sp. NIES-4071]|nr:hypothetical protein NIES4071_106410 [Calothrix sp. NIES-4071]BAZ65059.1 hypothetical protein NIES4105_107920 [Calothrix sp. NIES-4105]
MPKLIKTCCVALLAGTALFISMDVQRAKASLVDDLYNQCVKAYQLEQLNNQGLDYCNKVVQLKQQTEQRSRMINDTYSNPSFIYPNPGLINEATDIIRSGINKNECAYDTSCASTPQYPYAYPTNPGF